ncbi:lipocalin-like domain-containing protein [Rhodanobacter sp. DHG33]|uniref:lipocalin-like domain-containing protein n=1 Tax=Rhodanobacter sp. DHG33 TaxID=2775921 RepID=UPI00177C431C|nr:lipocalin-like domain-containing protein [Rhodanobacter sp. DHG33]MBD8898498.1 lipocalin-like domain-containing protein [Rhodanobacter sp. DHG33]
MLGPLLASATDSTTNSAFEQAVLRADNASDSAPGEVPASLVGAWTLVRVDNVYPDGHRVALYGPHPEGLWIIDAHGRYMMQMVRAQRTGFVANDKSKGTPEEYRAASLDSNAHYGQIRADATTFHTHIEHASFPNWDGKSGGSAYTLKGDLLTYTVAKPSSGAEEGAHGEVEWQRLP